MRLIYSFSKFISWLSEKESSLNISEISLSFGWWLSDQPWPAHRWPCLSLLTGVHSRGRPRKRANTREELGRSMMARLLLRFLRFSTFPFKQQWKLKGEVRAVCEEADFSPECHTVTAATVAEPSHHYVISQENFYCHISKHASHTGLF